MLPARAGVLGTDVSAARVHCARLEDGRRDVGVVLGVPGDHPPGVPQMSARSGSDGMHRVRSPTLRAQECVRTCDAGLRATPSDCSTEPRSTRCSTSSASSPARCSATPRCSPGSPRCPWPPRSPWCWSRGHCSPAPACSFSPRSRRRGRIRRHPPARPPPRRRRSQPGIRRADGRCRRWRGCARQRSRSRSVQCRAADR